MIPLRDDDPDYAALVMGNYIFGAATLRRAWRSHRQKEGLSHGVSSSFKRVGIRPAGEPDDHGHLQSANIGRVEKAAQEELDRLLRDRRHAR